jgi:uncharacterized repeat protein (TIGR01451 family)
MFKKMLSLSISLLFVLSQPLAVLAQVDVFDGYDNLPAGGMGFFKYPSEEIPGHNEAYFLRGAGGGLWVTEDAIWLTQVEDAPSRQKGEHLPAEGALKAVNLKVSFPGANPDAVLEAEGRMPGHVSILKGENPEEWARELPLWGLLRYRHLYPGVDLVIRSTDSGFDWEYEVQAGADLDQLRLWIQGAHAVTQDKFGTILETSLGDLRLPALGLEGPEGALSADGTTRLVYGDWVEVYPQDVQLEIRSIDPVDRLTYSTYLGGSAREYGNDVALDAQNNAYVVGETLSPDFPVNTGDTTIDHTDAFISKLNMNVSPPSLAYATYLGGNGIDRASGVGVQNGIAYLIGDTDSSNFPLAGDAADVDVFAVALNETGSGLNYAKLIGGSEPIGDAEDYGYAIVVENSNAYLTGLSYSDNFPVTNGDGDSTGGDVFIVKLNSEGSTIYSTLLGGKYVDAGYGIDVSNGIAWVTGETDSDDFIGRVSDSAVFVISLTGIGLMDTARVFDGSLYERGFDLVLDIAGDVYVTGFTNSTDFPVTNGSIYAGGLSDAFLIKLNHVSTIYSTYLGGSSSDHGLGIDVDAIGGVVVVGDTFSTDFPVTSDAFQDIYAGGGDIFITRYFLAGDDPGFRSYSSYLGGTSMETPKAIDMDNLVSAYIFGDTYSTDFPVTPDAFDQSANGNLDVFLSVMAVAPLPAVQIEKFTNGLDSDEAPGEYFLPDTPLTWTYQVTNNGEVPLINVEVTDSKGIVVDCGGIASLNPDQSIVCTASGFAEPDQYGNLGIVTAEDSLLGTVVSDVDASHYFGAVPDTELVKLTNDQDVDLVSEVYVETDGTVTWSYVVTNTGNVQLTGVNVTDDKGVMVTCPKSILEPGESMTCTASGTAVAGQYENTGTVIGVPPVGPNVSDFDLSHYFGSAPGIEIVKKANGDIYTETDPLYILDGDPITWTYELHNSGNVDLTNVTVMDDPGTMGDTSDDTMVCTGITLKSEPDPGAYHTCTMEGEAVLGAYHNTATVTGNPPVGSDVTASAYSYYFGSDPAVALEYSVNADPADTSPGLYVLLPATLTLEYKVTNTGNVPLSNLVVTDGSYTCNIDSLPVGEFDTTCTQTMTALSGQQSATASVTGAAPAPLDAVNATDPMYYFGAEPVLILDKQTNGQDPDSTPGVYVETGSTVNWTYDLLNDGNVKLENVRVVDDNGTPDNSDDDYEVCKGITLYPPRDPGGDSTHTCNWSKEAVEGQYSNVAVAYGDPPSPLSRIDAEDTSYYFGATLVVTLEKSTNGEDADTGTGPLIGVGGLVEWEYVVTNNSNISIVFTIEDNPTADIFCPTTSLGSGMSTYCEASGEAIAGQYENTATITVTPPGSLSTFDVQDTSHYFGVTTGIDIEKHTQGQDADAPTGPLIKIDTPVQWDYFITNMSNVILTNVTVVDDNGTPGDTSDDFVVCDKITLQPYLEEGYTHTCSDSSVLAVAGQYVNVATVTGDSPTGFDQVTDTDSSHYFGSDAGVELTKLTNGVDTGLDDPPYVLVGDPVEWTYLVKNIGNLNISNIVVTDTDESLTILCNETVLVDGQLLPGVTMTCTASGTAIEGRYDNTAYVEGTPYGFETEKVQDSDASAYFGANPSIDIEKSTEGYDADDPPGPYIPVGEPITLQYEVSNPETDYRFIDIQVTDDEGVMVNCPSTRLDPGDEPMICTAESTADSGQQALSGHVSARVVVVASSQELGSVEDSDPGHYFGYTAPGLTLTKYTNGIAVEGPPGPELIVGSSVTWTYEVINESNAPVADLSVSDNPVGVVACEKDGLEGNETITCSASGEVEEGQYSNTAQATGVFIPTEEEISSLVASSYYYGVRGSKLFLPLLLR